MADAYDLARFLRAQERDYDQALAEIRGGRKQSHWMWYIFPQLTGLGRSATARQFGIASLAEADAYMRHHVLGPRLQEICQAALDVEGRSALDDLRLPRRPEAALVRDAVCLRGPGRVGIRAAARPLLRRPT